MPAVARPLPTQVGVWECSAVNLLHSGMHGLHAARSSGVPSSVQQQHMWRPYSAAAPPRRPALPSQSPSSPPLPGAGPLWLGLPQAGCCLPSSPSSSSARPREVGRLLLGGRVCIACVEQRHSWQRHSWRRSGRRIEPICTALPAPRPETCSRGCGWWRPRRRRCPEHL